MTPPNSAAINELIRQGVRIPHPGMVHIADEVDIKRIAGDCVLHPGCRLTGRDLSIGPRCVLGDEAPLTLNNCQLGADVKISGGYAAESTFLDGASVGSSAHIRPGVLLEEKAQVAHAAGLKQTILLPRVVTGSLINFCDCLMAGGTGRGVHSEVGSSYIHFNYTPRGDKATASLFGDVPRGVLLDQPPIFLGGQGGAVGPVRVDFGVFIPAGVILRRDVLAGQAAPKPGPDPATPLVNYPFGEYRSIDRIIRNCLVYAGNILALREWYGCVRTLFANSASSRACLLGAMTRLDIIWKERLARMRELAIKVGDSAARLARRTDAPRELVAIQKQFSLAWPDCEERLNSMRDFKGCEKNKNVVLETISAGQKTAYLEAIEALSDAARKAATAWLDSIVRAVAATWPESEIQSRSKTNG